MELRTDRLILKPLSSADAEMVLELLTNDCIKKTYMLPDYEQREDALPLFRRLAELSQDETHYVRGIYQNDHLVGLLNDVEIKNGTIELGYVIHPDHQGQGYMTEALRGAITDLFRMGYREVVAGAFEHNAASIRTMVKAGMNRLPKTDEIEYHGETHRCVYYSIRNQE